MIAPINSEIKPESGFAFLAKTWKEAATFLENTLRISSKLYTSSWLLASRMFRGISLVMALGQGPSRCGHHFLCVSKFGFYSKWHARMPTTFLPFNQQIMGDQLRKGSESFLVVFWKTSIVTSWEDQENDVNMKSYMMSVRSLKNISETTIGHYSKKKKMPHIWDAAVGDQHPEQHRGFHYVGKHRWLCFLVTTDDSEFKSDSRESASNVKRF